MKSKYQIILIINVLIIRIGSKSIFNTKHWNLEETTITLEYYFMSSYVMPYQINVDMTKQINRLMGKLIYLIDRLIDLWIKRLIKDTITFQADLSYKLHLFK